MAKKKAAKAKGTTKARNIVSNETFFLAWNDPTTKTLTDVQDKTKMSYQSVILRRDKLLEKNVPLKKLESAREAVNVEALMAALEKKGISLDGVELEQKRS